MIFEYICHDMGFFDIFSSGSDNKPEKTGNNRGNTGTDDKYPSDWNTRRKEVYKDDDYTCQVCGDQGGNKGGAELHAHHKIPISEGGSHRKSNLITLCRKCHNKIHNGDLSLKGSYYVALEAAWLVRDVKNVGDAIEVAVNSAEERINEADLEHIDVQAGVNGCPTCEEPLDSVFIAADTGIVGLLITVPVFNADSPVHACQIAKSVLDDPLPSVPLILLDIVDEEEAKSK